MISIIFFNNNLKVNNSTRMINENDNNTVTNMIQADTAMVKSVQIPRAWLKQYPCIS